MRESRDSDEIAAERPRNAGRVDAADSAQREREMRERGRRERERER